MTIALVVACADRFYMICDTLMSDEKTNVYTLNNQKSFFSNRHQIGLCIAGDATLSNQKPGENILDENILNVAFILNSFFADIDARPTGKTIGVYDLMECLTKYLEKSFPTYKDGFMARVSFFYGGFVESGHGMLQTVVGEHHVQKNDDEGGDTITDQTIPFSTEYLTLNTALCVSSAPTGLTGSLRAYLKGLGSNDGSTLTCQDGAVLNHAQILSSNDPRLREWVATHVVPNLCSGINLEHPGSIGRSLKFFSCKSDKSTEEYWISYNFEKTTTPFIGSTRLDKAPDTCTPIIWKSIQEEKIKLASKEIIVYDCNTDSVRHCDNKGELLTFEDAKSTSTAPSNETSTPIAGMATAPPPATSPTDTPSPVAEMIG